MPDRVKLLFVDDEEKFLASMATRLSLRDFDVDTCNSGRCALELADKKKFDVVLLDLKMPEMGGEEVLQRLKEKDPELEVVILTGHGSISSAVDCTRMGAFEYLQKPCDLDAVISSISAAYAKRIKKRKSHKAAKVEDLMTKAFGYSPLELLKELKKIENE